MRGEVVVETQEEFDAYMAKQTPQYLLANPKLDPSKQIADTTAKPSGDAAVISANQPVKPKS
jgi:cytochrome c oxidase subunit 2